MKIKYNPDKYDTIDKVLGLAQSKLYSRVLTRITGAFIVDEPESIDITSDVEDHGDTKHKTPIPRKRKSAASLPANETSKADYTDCDEEKTLSPIVQELSDLFNDPEHAEAFANLPHDEIRYAIARNNEAVSEQFLMEAKIGG